MSKRSKSNLVPPEPAASWIEPQRGPGSATCYCRVMDRREKAREARQMLQMAADVEEEQVYVVPPLANRLNRPIAAARWRARA
jgi:hypothetical protein